jgi:hypothetical protein
MFYVERYDIDSCQWRVAGVFTHRMAAQEFILTQYLSTGVVHRIA